ncbi:MAG: hypothetical protein GF307_04965 [candidate division Zixibacteria bacterium]|nr:hypothetical protein [candidate division Zixibacteria bacterium]
MKRRRGRRISLLILGSLALIVSVILAVFFFTDLPEKQVNNLLDVLISAESGVEVHIGNLNRTWWGELELFDITIDYQKGDTTYRLAEVKSLYTDYSLIEFIQGRFVVTSLIINEPRIYLKKDKQGNLIFPGGSEKGDPSAGIAILPGLIYGAQYFELNEGMIELYEQDNRIDSLNIAGTARRLPPDTLSAKIYMMDFVYPRKDFEVSKFTTEIRFSPGKIDFDDVKLITGNSDARGSLSLLLRDTLEYSFNFNGDNFSFEEMSRIAGTKLRGDIQYKITGNGKGGLIQGDAVLNGYFFERKFENVQTGFRFQDKKLSFHNVSGKIFGASVTGDGRLNLGVKPEEYSADIRIKGFNLSNLVFNSLDTEFNGQLLIDGRGFNDDNMYMNFNADLGFTRIETYQFDSTRGEFGLNVKRIDFEDGCQAFYKNTATEYSGFIEYGGNLEIKGTADFRNLDNFDGQIFLTDIGGRGNASFIADGLTGDFNLNARFTSDSCHIYGIYTPDFEMDLSLNTFVNHPIGKVDFGWSGGDIYTLGVERVDGYTVVAGDYTFIDSVNVDYPAGDMFFQGKYDGTLFPPRLAIDSSAISFFDNKLINNQQIKLLIGEEDVEITSMIYSVNSGLASLAGIIDYDENMDLALTLDRLDISPFASIIDPGDRWDGILSCNIMAGGNFENPSYVGAIEIDGFGYRFYALGDIDSKFSYRDESLIIDSFNLTDSLENITASGYIPIDLSLAETETRIPDTTFFVNFKASGEQLNVATIFIPQIEYLFGSFNASMIIDNTVYKPTFNGRLRMEDGVLKVQDWVEPIYGLECDIILQDKEIKIEKAEGHFEYEDNRRQSIFQKLYSALFSTEDRRGRVGVNGSIDVRSLDNFDYSLDVTGKDIPLVHELYDISAIVDINAEVTGTTPPLVTGDVEVVQFIYNEPFVSSGSDLLDVEPVHAIDENMWNLDLDIYADNNIWVINPDMEAEFEGEVNLTRRLGLYRVQGEIGVIRGRYYLPTLVDFKIDEGQILFNDPEFVSFNFVDPELNILASKRIYQSDADEKLIELRVSGELSEPTLSLSSGEDSQQEILEYLAFRRSLDGSSTDSIGTDNSLGERGVGLFSDLISRQIKSQARQTLGVETLEIQPSESGGFDLSQTRIAVGKYISPSVYLKYSTKLSTASGQEIAAEYRLNRNFSLEAKTDEDNLYHVDFNFKLEFK